MKKLFSIVSSVLLLLTSVAPAAAYARSIKPQLQARPIIRPFCGNNRAEASPGNPVHLKGTGIACAWGKGFLGYRISAGRASIGGSGLVAIKGTDAKTSGWDHHFNLFGWQVYVGTGRISARGNNFQLIGYLKSARTRARGTGSATYKGSWKIRFGRILKVTPAQIEALDIPTQIRDQAPTQALEVIE